MIKFNFLFILSLCLYGATPAHASDLWRDAKRFVLANSGTISLVAVAAAAAASYYYLAPTTTPSVKPKKFVPKTKPTPAPGDMARSTKSAYRKKRVKYTLKIEAQPKIIET